MSIKPRTVDFTKVKVREPDHFDYLFRGTRGWVCFSIKDEATGGWTEDQFDWSDQGEGAKQDRARLRNFVRQYSDAPGKHLFYCPNPMKGQRRTLHTSASRYVIHADIDNGGLTDALRDMLEKRGFRIVSSGTPGNGHVYARLSRSLSPEEHDAAQEALRKKVNGDAKIRDNDLLRVPGSRNWKPGNDGARVEIIARGKRSLDADKMMKWLGAKPQKKSRVTTPAVESVDPAAYPYPTAKMQSDNNQWLLHHTTGDRSDDIYHLVRALQERGFTFEEIVGVAFKYEPAVDKWPNPADLIKDVQRIYGDRPNVQHWTGEEGFWNRRASLRYVYDYALASRTGPWATLGIVLARVLYTVPPYVVLPGVGMGGSLNFYVGLVGPVGAGKTRAMTAAEQVIDADIRIDRPGSGQGLAHLFRQYNATTGVCDIIATAAFLEVDEIDQISALASGKGATLDAELRSVFFARPLGGAYAAREKRLDVPQHSYRAVMTVGIQPKRAHDFLSKGDGGTPQRFLWMPVHNEHAPDKRPPKPEGWAWRRPEYKPGEIYVPESVLDEIDRADLERHRGKEGNEDEAHAMFVRLKVAASLALLDGRVAMNEEDWELSETVMHVSTQTREKVKRELEQVQRRATIAAGKVTGIKNAVAVETAQAHTARRVTRVADNLLSKLTGDWEAGNPLARRALASRDRPYFDAAMDLLCAEGKASVKEHRGGRQFRRTR